MPNTFSELYIHHVSAVKYRRALILPEFEEQLFAYIRGIASQLNQTILAINGMPDHIHIAARLRPTMRPSEFVQKIKSNSSRWINEQAFLTEKFVWQTGGGIFSISRTHVAALITYINNQKAIIMRSPLKKSTSTFSSYIKLKCRRNIYHNLLSISIDFCRSSRTHQLSLSCKGLTTLAIIGRPSGTISSSCKYHYGHLKLPLLQRVG